MSELKYIEVRDRMTFIPAVAFRLGDDPTEAARWMLFGIAIGEARPTDTDGEFYVPVKLT